MLSLGPLRHPSFVDGKSYGPIRLDPHGPRFFAPVRLYIPQPPTPALLSSVGVEFGISEQIMFGENMSS